MADKPQVKTVVKKINAYPFNVYLKLASGNLTGQLVKLTLQGFLAEIPATNLQPGERFELSFETPVHHRYVTEMGKIIKIYNQYAGAAASGGTPAASAAPAGGPVAAGAKHKQLIEVHFISLTDEHKDIVKRFLADVAKAPVA